MPKEIQEKAIDQLVLLYTELMVKLIQPSDKSCWDNAAKVLMRIGCPTNEIILAKLLEWLKDMNWPGALIVREILKTVDLKILLPHIKGALKSAANDKDFIWIAWLKELIDYLGASKNELLDKETQDLLGLAEW